MLPLLCLAVLPALFVQHVSAASVIAHFMVQNSYAYDVNMWKSDMSTAKDMGIDGFALNWTPPDCANSMAWTVKRIDDAFSAAEQVGFKLLHSFDMSYTQCNIYWNQTFMQQMIEKHAGSSATYRWNSNILVSTYGGDMVQQYGNQFFQGLKNNMKSTNAITIAPALTRYSMGIQGDSSQATKLMSDYPSIDGYFNWQAWPLNSDSNITVNADKSFQAALRSAGRAGPYIMGVSPWQYKDLNNGNPLDAWVAYSDTLFPNRLASLTAANGVSPDIIEIQTWNDFSESHYLRDLPSQDMSAKDYVQLGNMGAYVYGQDHGPWRIIAKYYINWWKTGSPPAIQDDQVVFWHRIHPKSAVCSGGASTGIRNSAFPADAVFAWALVSQDSTISMSIGTNKYWNFHADGSGPTMGMVPFPANLGSSGAATPEVAIIRNGATIAVNKSAQPVTAYCDWTNFNPIVNLVS